MLRLTSRARNQRGRIYIADTQRLAVCIDDDANFPGLECGQRQTAAHRPRSRRPTCARRAGARLRCASGTGSDRPLRSTWVFRRDAVHWMVRHARPHLMSIGVFKQSCVLALYCRSKRNVGWALAHRTFLRREKSGGPRPTLRVTIWFGGAARFSSTPSPGALTLPHVESSRRRNKPLLAPARGQSGRMVALVRCRTCRGARKRQADFAVDWLQRLSLVPRNGARVLRGRCDRASDERPVRSTSRSIARRGPDISTRSISFRIRL